MKGKPLFVTLFLASTGFLMFFTSSSNIHAVLKPVGEPNAERAIIEYQPTEEDKAFIARFEEYILEAFKQTHTPGASVAIVKNGVVLYQKGLGVKAAGSTDSVDTKTLFRIASVSKGFASILAGLAAKDSLIRWDDTIENYLTHPLKGKAKDITIRHILSHTGGFPYQAFSTLVEDYLPRDTMINRLLRLKLPRHPGEIHSYQNVAYSIIEPVLEKATGIPFSQLIHQKIFTPLAMNATSIAYDSIINNENVAMPHNYRYRRFLPTNINPGYYNVAAAGGINTNIEDMTHWMTALLGHRSSILPETVIDEVFTPVIGIRVRNSYLSRLDPDRKGYYGMGWRIIDYPQDTIIYHGGYANGYKSVIALDRDKQIAICILSNAPSKFSNLALTNFFTMYNEQLKKPDTPETGEMMVRK